MNWKTNFSSNNVVWSSIEGYADERIADLTATCVNRNSSEWDIRCAQAGIEEMQKLKALPAAMSAEAQARASSMHNRKGY